MSFPAGEQFFIDAVRAGVTALPPERRGRFADEVQGFIGQEATHRRIHALFNEQLARQGHVNPGSGASCAGGARSPARPAPRGGASPRRPSTSPRSSPSWLLRHPEVLAGAEPRLRTLWLWHRPRSPSIAAPPSTCTALGGNERWRRRCCAW